MPDPEQMTPAQRELIEEFGLLQERMGGTRMTGRMSVSYTHLTLPTNREV